jgi:hypothetical protein
MSEMPTTRTEYADMPNRNAQPFVGLARKTGLPIGYIAELFAKGEARSLFDDRGQLIVDPANLTPTEKLRFLERRRYAPGCDPCDTFKSGEAALSWLESHRYPPTAPRQGISGRAAQQILERMRR